MDVNDKVGCRYKGAGKKASRKNKEDEATDGDGVVTMKAYEKY